MKYTAHMCGIIIVVDSYYPFASTNPSLFNMVDKSPYLTPNIASDLL